MSLICVNNPHSYFFLIKQGDWRKSKNSVLSLCRWYPFKTYQQSGYFSYARIHVFVEVRKDMGKHKRIVFSIFKLHFVYFNGTYIIWIQFKVVSRLELQLQWERNLVKIINYCWVFQEFKLKTEKMLILATAADVTERGFEDSFLRDPLQRLYKYLHVWRTCMNTTKWVHSVNCFDAGSHTLVFLSYMLSKA